MSRNNKDSNGITFGGFLLRLLAALILVFATYNPSGYSAWDWISRAIADSNFGPLHLLVIGLLLIGWTIYWIATWRSLGALGFALVGLVLAALVWLLIDLGLLKTESISAMAWIVLVCIAAALAIGVSWSHVWRRITGQINVEDVDD